ncbi:MAG: 50S ribosomal protein L39e [Crenarchaeota archaeon]|nr:50S ribosomal protein L39e [Thermoproteota archaeon]MCR8454317.1 50S ribosomal protein L39e [Thermoproteota archaeon]MCR8455085.1 50S ribosomal protein L39e [Thermoproteota archaeon]MCR8463556.1 50S ribosomal protein L39e [Thermoproteota archaeon]MCR8470825.1 50S ribosomal protein L39e [Thermoproteota archaeon]
MARVKPLAKKIRLASASKSNRMPPLFVRIKTNFRVIRSPAQRNWRRVKIKP